MKNHCLRFLSESRNSDQLGSVSKGDGLSFIPNFGFDKNVGKADFLGCMEEIERLDKDYERKKTKSHQYLRQQEEEEKKEHKTRDKEKK